MKRNKHSLSHYLMTTCKMGQLVPIGCFEVLPGDTIQHATSLLIRTTPLNTPVMHPIHVRVHHFYVPLRQIWPNFTKFITGGANGQDATAWPTVTVTPTVGSLHDYLGVPVGTAQTVSALPMRAYTYIFNEYYQDQDLVTPLALSTADGADVTTAGALQNVAWEKDYFTSARPWTDKGAAVTLPLGTAATVKVASSNLVTGAQSFYMKMLDISAGAAPATSQQMVHGPSGDGGVFRSATTSAPTGSGSYPANLYADLSTATAATINQLRHAFAIQRYQEARAMYGSRYSEYLRYLGITSSDLRLQRPLCLGTGRSTIQFSEVLQTAPTTSGTPTTGVGSLMGHGIGSVRSNRYRYFFEEHGIVLSLLSVLPKTIYYGGLPQMWSRSTRELYWQKELEHIGQQEIYNREIYAAHSSPNGIFGYQDRYDDYRRKESRVSGLFGTTQKTWNDARIFGSDPTLNSAFVTANPDARIFQDTANDHIYVMANHSIQARRMVDAKGIPGRIS